MALRNRTAITQNILNQENTKNVKSTINPLPGHARRAALGEIGNKVNTVRGAQPIKGSSLLPTVDLKKPILKQQQQVKVDKVSGPPVQVVKPVVKKDIVQENIKKIDDIKQNEYEQQIFTDVDCNNKQKNEAFSSDLLEIQDIDEEDKGNPILVTVYSNDIYEYLRKLESIYPIDKEYLNGQEVTPKMRSVLVDWLVEVHQQFHLLQETLYLTVAIIDRFLQSYRTINRKRLQLVGVSSMFIACKYEEMYAPDIGDFVYITDNAYHKTEILQMEMLIVRTLDYSFGRPLSLHFLRRYSKAGSAMPLHHTMAKYFLEQCLVSYNMCHYSPSLIAAAAIYLAFYLLGNEEKEGRVIWTPTLAHYSTYTKNDLLPVVKEIASIIGDADTSKYQAVRKKFISSKHLKISLRPELRSPVLHALANNKE